MDTIGAPDSNTAPTACATGMRCLRTPAGCWILPQPSHLRLQAKRGSNSTISGNFSRLRSFCSAKYVATLMDWRSGMAIWLTSWGAARNGAIHGKLEERNEGRGRLIFHRVPCRSGRVHVLEHP